MMKKVWSVLPAVVLVFGLVAIGCGSSSSGSSGNEGEGDLVVKTVFVLSTDEGIQALTAGEDKLSFAGDANPIKPLVRAGGDDNIDIFAITAPGGTIGLKFKTIATWGAGIDLPFKEFGYREGDIVTVTGKLVAGDKTQLNFKEGSEATYPSTTTTTAGEDFDYSVTLSATDILSIKGGKTTQVIRIEGRPANVEVEIYEITITGKRPSKLTKLEAPVITASATGISWTAIENTSGFKVLVAKDGEEYVEEDAVSLAATATGYDMSKLADGTYKVSVTALGLKDSTTDSDTVEVKVKKETPATQTEKTIDVSGAAKTKGTVTDNTATGFTFEYPSSGSDINYGNSYAYFQVNLTPQTLASLIEVRFNYKGLAGDYNWKTIRLQISKTAFTGWASSEDHTVETQAVGTGKDLTITINHAKTTALEGETTLYFAFIPWAKEEDNGATTKYTISNVKFLLGDPATFTIVN